MPQYKTNVTDALDLFLIDGQSRRFADSTLKWYSHTLNRFIDHLQDQNVTYLDDVTVHHIRAYQVKFTDHSSSYAHGQSRAIRAFLNFAQRDELIESNPFDKVKMPVLAKKILRALDTDEIKKILSAAPTERDKAIFMVLLDSGVRAKELLNLNVGDVDEKGAVTVRQGKQQKDRVTYIGAKTRRQLKTYYIKERSGTPDDDEPMFTSIRGQRLSYVGLSHMIKRVRESIEIKDCSAHTFRRTFAISCLRNGMDIFVLARLMGHADIAMLKRYLAHVREDLAAEHKDHGVIDNL